jgi:hypothetical protein
MAIDHEAPYTALFQRLQSDVIGLVTMSEKLKHWENVEPPAQPALFMALSDQTPINAFGLPPRWLLEAELYLYVHSDPDDAQDIPRKRINVLIKSIEEGMEWRPADLAGTGQNRGEERHQTTLGGLVQYAWISGIQIAEGVAVGQSAARFTVEMLAVA